MGDAAASSTSTIFFLAELIVKSLAANAKGFLKGKPELDLSAESVDAVLQRLKDNGSVVIQNVTLAMSGNVSQRHPLFFRSVVAESIKLDTKIDGERYCGGKARLHITIRKIAVVAEIIPVEELVPLRCSRLSSVATIRRDYARGCCPMASSWSHETLSRLVWQILFQFVLVTIDNVLVTLVDHRQSTVACIELDTLTIDDSGERKQIPTICRESFSRAFPESQPTYPRSTSSFAKDAWMSNISLRIGSGIDSKSCEPPVPTEFDSEETSPMRQWYNEDRMHNAQSKTPTAWQLGGAWARLLKDRVEKSSQVITMTYTDVAIRVGCNVENEKISYGGHNVPNIAVALQARLVDVVFDDFDPRVIVRWMRMISSFHRYQLHGLQQPTMFRPREWWRYLARRALVQNRTLRRGMKWLVLTEEAKKRLVFLQLYGKHKCDPHAMTVGERRRLQMLTRSLPLGLRALYEAFACKSILSQKSCPERAKQEALAVMARWGLLLDAWDEACHGTNSLSVVDIYIDNISANVRSDDESAWKACCYDVALSTAISKTKGRRLEANRHGHSENHAPNPSKSNLKIVTESRLIVGRLWAESGNDMICNDHIFFKIFHDAPPADSYEWSQSLILRPPINRVQALASKAAIIFERTFSRSLDHTTPAQEKKWRGELGRQEADQPTHKCMQEGYPGRIRLRVLPVEVNVPMDVRGLGLRCKECSLMNAIVFVSTNVFGSFGIGRNTLRMLNCVEIDVQLKGINLNLHVPGIDLLTPGCTQAFAIRVGAFKALSKLVAESSRVIMTASPSVGVYFFNHRRCAATLESQPTKKSTAGIYQMNKPSFWESVMSDTKVSMQAEFGGLAGSNLKSIKLTVDTLRLVVSHNFIETVMAVNQSFAKTVLLTSTYAQSTSAKEEDSDRRRRTSAQCRTTNQDSVVVAVNMFQKDYHGEITAVAGIGQQANDINTSKLNLTSSSRSEGMNQNADMHAIRCCHDLPDLNHANVSFREWRDAVEKVDPFGTVWQADRVENRCSFTISVISPNNLSAAGVTPASIHHWDVFTAVEDCKTSLRCGHAVEYPKALSRELPFIAVVDVESPKRGVSLLAINLSGMAEGWCLMTPIRDHELAEILRLEDPHTKTQKIYPTDWGGVGLDTTTILVRLKRRKNRSVEIILMPPLLFANGLGIPLHISLHLSKVGTFQSAMRENMSRTASDERTRVPGEQDLHISFELPSGNQLAPPTSWLLDTNQTQVQLEVVTNNSDGSQAKGTLKIPVETYSEEAVLELKAAGPAGSSMFVQLRLGKMLRKAFPSIRRTNRPAKTVSNDWESSCPTEVVFLPTVTLKNRVGRTIWLRLQDCETLQGENASLMHGEMLQTTALDARNDVKLAVAVSGLANMGWSKAVFVTGRKQQRELVIGLRQGTPLKLRVLYEEATLGGVNIVIASWGWIVNLTSLPIHVRGGVGTKLTDATQSKFGVALHRKQTNQSDERNTSVRSRHGEVAESIRVQTNVESDNQHITNHDSTFSTQLGPPSPAGQGPYLEPGLVGGRKEGHVFEIQKTLGRITPVLLSPRVAVKRAANLFNGIVNATRRNNLVDEHAPSNISTVTVDFPRAQKAEVYTTLADRRLFRRAISKRLSSLTRPAEETDSSTLPDACVSNRSNTNDFEGRDENLYKGTYEGHLEPAVLMQNAGQTDEDNTCDNAVHNQRSIHHTGTGLLSSLEQPTHDTELHSVQHDPILLSSNIERADRFGGMGISLRLETGTSWSRIAPLALLKCGREQTRVLIDRDGSRFDVAISCKQTSPPQVHGLSATPMLRILPRFVIVNHLAVDIFVRADTRCVGETLRARALRLEQFPNLARDGHYRIRLRLAMGREVEHNTSSNPSLQEPWTGAIPINYDSEYTLMCCSSGAHARMLSDTNIVGRNSRFAHSITGVQTQGGKQQMEFESESNNDGIVLVHVRCATINAVTYVVVRALPRQHTPFRFLNATQTDLSLSQIVTAFAARPSARNEQAIAHTQPPRHMLLAGGHMRYALDEPTMGSSVRIVPLKMFEGDSTAAEAKDVCSSGNNHGRSANANKYVSVDLANLDARTIGKFIGPGLFLTAKRDGSGWFLKIESREEDHRDTRPDQVDDVDQCHDNSVGFHLAFHVHRMHVSLVDRSPREVICVSLKDQVFDISTALRGQIHGMYSCIGIQIDDQIENETTPLSILPSRGQTTAILIQSQAAIRDHSLLCWGISAQIGLVRVQLDAHIARVADLLKDFRALGTMLRLPSPDTNDLFLAHLRDGRQEDRLANALRLPSRRLIEARMKPRVAEMCPAQILLSLSLINYALHRPSEVPPRGAGMLNRVQAKIEAGIVGPVQIRDFRIEVERPKFSAVQPLAMPSASTGMRSLLFMLRHTDHVTLRIPQVSRLPGHSLSQAYESDVLLQAPRLLLSAKAFGNVGRAARGTGHFIAELFRTATLGTETNTFRLAAAGFSLAERTGRMSALISGGLALGLVTTFDPDPTTSQYLRESLNVSPTLAQRSFAMTASLTLDAARAILVRPAARYLQLRTQSALVRNQEEASDRVSNADDLERETASKNDDSRSAHRLSVSCSMFGWRNDFDVLRTTLGMDARHAIAVLGVRPCASFLASMSKCCSAVAAVAASTADAGNMTRPSSRDTSGARHQPLADGAGADTATAVVIGDVGLGGKRLVRKSMPLLFGQDGVQRNYDVAEATVAHWLRLLLTVAPGLGTESAANKHDFGYGFQQHHPRSYEYIDHVDVGRQKLVLLTRHAMLVDVRPLHLHWLVEKSAVTLIRRRGCTMLIHCDGRAAPLELSSKQGHLLDWACHRLQRWQHCENTNVK